MRISHERLIFALSVLDGEEGAHRILADLLEEEGDRGLAEWARAKKGKRHRRIDFVLALLPHQISLRLASDFLVRSLTLLDAHQWRGSPEPSTQRLSLSPAIEAVQGIGQWSQGLSTEEALERHRRVISTVVPWSHGIQDIDTTMRALRAAVDYSEMADVLKEKDSRSSAHHSRESRNSSRKVAKASREMTRPLMADLQWRALHGKRKLPDETVPDVDFVSWQIDHTRSIINELLNGAEAS